MEELNLDGSVAKEITKGNIEGLRCFAFRRPGDLAFIHGNTKFYYREEEFNT